MWLCTRVSRPQHWTHPTPHTSLFWGAVSFTLGMFSSIPGLYPSLHASSNGPHNPHGATIKSVSRYCPMSPGEGECKIPPIWELLYTLVNTVPTTWNNFLRLCRKLLLIFQDLFYMLLPVWSFPLIKVSNFFLFLPLIPLTFLFFYLIT